MKYNYYISQEELLKARRNSKLMFEILEKIKPYLITMTSKIYYKWCKNDNMVEYSDVYQELCYQIIKAVKKSFNPSRYDETKDINHYYSNAFTFINKICVNYLLWNKWNLGKKRRMKNVISIEESIHNFDGNQDNKLTIKDTLTDKSHSSNISFVTALLLNKINKIEDQKIKNILLDIIQGNIKNKTQLKRKYNLKEKELSEIYQKLRK